MTDLTTITTPMALLDKATAEALRDCGGPYDRWNPLAARWDQYLNDATPSFDDGHIYRVRPEHPRPLVVRDWSVFADWVRFVARDNGGQLWAYECHPEAYVNFWSSGGRNNILTAFSPTIIDPGTCDWREAIAERPDEGDVETFTSKAFCVNHRALPAVYHTEVGNSHPGDFTLTTRNGKPVRAVWESDQ